MGPSRGRRHFLLLTLLCGFGVILFRLVTLQVLQAAELTARADRQHSTTSQNRICSRRAWESNR